MSVLDLLLGECNAHGIECFVVGGALRDRLLDMAVREIDLVIRTHPEHLLETLGIIPGLRAFWLDKGRGMLRLSDGETSIDLSPLSGSLEEDLEQRDFTVNAMAQRLADYMQGSEQVIDPFNGREDLRIRRLRPVSQNSMQADPVRVLRGVRLLTTRGLQLDAASTSLLQKAAVNLRALPAERISQELAQILVCANAPAGVDYMHHLGVVEQILPEVAAMKGITQNQYHQYTVSDHTSRAFAAFVEIVHQAAFLTRRAEGWARAYWCGLSEKTRYAVMLAAWLHDIGKPPTREVRDGKITFYGHEHKGAVMSREVASRLRLSREQSDILASFIKFHMYPMQLWRTGKLDGRLLHRYYQRTGAVGIPVALFTLADHLAKGEAVAESETFLEHMQVVERFLEAWFEQQEAVISPRPLLTGDEIARLLARRPGPWLRKVKELLLEAQAGNQVTDRGQAEQYILQAAQQVDRMR